jgi:hypothetical protein
MPTDIARVEFSIVTVEQLIRPKAKVAKIIARLPEPKPTGIRFDSLNGMVLIKVLGSAFDVVLESKL